MSRYLLALLLAISPAAAQVKLAAKGPEKGTVKSAAAQPDVCAPIGRTADGTLV